ncbi:MAG: hypothetical protein IJ438_12290 [Clostridia bacterium]|nr:hypothetical protein [Clostridia bacterium]
MPAAFRTLAAVAIVLSLLFARLPLDVSLADTQWVDQDGYIYSFNADETQFSCRSLAICYTLGADGFYHNTWISQGGMYYDVGEPYISFSLSGDTLTMQYAYEDRAAAIVEFHRLQDTLSPE